MTPFWQVVLAVLGAYPRRACSGASVGWTAHHLISTATFPE
jgi:hypothetical protein